MDDQHNVPHYDQDKEQEGMDEGINLVSLDRMDPSKEMVPIKDEESSLIACLLRNTRPYIDIMFGWDNVVYRERL